MSRVKWYLQISTVLSLLIIAASLRAALAQTAVNLTVQLRTVDGSPVVGEQLQLIAFSAELARAQSCQTNVAGLCTWQVASGLYELLSDNPLDKLSRYAVAEGGLRGLGLTVGDNPITYTLTIQPDGFLYFDTAPDALIPVPFIPTESNTHLTFTPVATSEISAESTTLISAETLTDNPTTIETVAIDSSSTPNRILFIIGVGIGVGIGSALLPRLRRYLQGGRDA